jgi:hypothetical protein
MSHFAVVLVIQDDQMVVPEKILDRVEQEMAPFMENCCAEPEKQFMKFYDEEDEYLKQYNEGSREMVEMPDGRLLLPWDEAFRKPPNKDDPLSAFGAPKASEDLPRKMVPFKETYSTFEEYVREWHGRKERDETFKRYGYWQNPNAKWDWFEIGGRWAGFFQLKKGRKGGKGSQYNLAGTMEASTDRADICLKSAIDLEAMRDQAEERAAKVYDKVQEMIKDTPMAESWEVIRSEFNLEKPGEIDKARDKYHDQPRVKAFRQASIEDVGWMTGVEEFQVPRNIYLRRARNGVATPFAVIKDGKWIEQGEMGWFGMASNEKDPETWNSMVAKMFDELPDTAILVAIDCHI